MKRYREVCNAFSKCNPNERLRQPGITNDAPCIFPFTTSKPWCHKLRIGKVDRNQQVEEYGVSPTASKIAWRSCE